MDAITITNRDGKDYKLVVLSPTGKGNPITLTGLTKDQAEELALYHRVRREKLIAHLNDVRTLLSEDYGFDPQAFEPIVE